MKLLLVTLIVLATILPNPCIKRRHSSKKTKFDNQILVLKNLKNPFIDEALKNNELLLVLEQQINDNLIDFTNHSEEQIRKAQVIKHWGTKNNDFSSVSNMSSEETKQDVESTKAHIERLVEKGLKKDSMLELASGNCRVYINLFHNMFAYREILEPVGKLVKACFENLSKMNEINLPDVIHLKTLEKYRFSNDQQFDFIFGEWILENITDLEIIKFLIDARKSLKPTSVLFFKENISIFEDKLHFTADMKQRIRLVCVYETLFTLAGYDEIEIKPTDNWKSYKLYEMSIKSKILKK